MTSGAERLAILAALFAPGHAGALIALLDDPEAPATAERAAALARPPGSRRLAALRAALGAEGSRRRHADALAAGERLPVAAALRDAARGVPARSRLLGRLMSEALSRRS